LNLSYTGRSVYSADYESGPDRLLVAVLCRVGDLPDRSYALLDTASEWCILSAEMARVWGAAAEEGAEVQMHTRLGTYEGQLLRVPILFLADEGESLEVSATCFVSEGWPGPMVVGWKGCLERLQFALKPSENSFYFAEL
jgi:hypothetical protein